jgi:hypothetical protein
MPAAELVEAEVAALGELPERLGDVAGEHRAARSSRAGTVSAAAAIAVERVTPCGSSASSWWATSCRRVEVAAGARQAAQLHGIAPDALCIQESMPLGTGAISSSSVTTSIPGNQPPICCRFDRLLGEMSFFNE